MKILLAGDNWIQGFGTIFKKLNPTYEIDILVNTPESYYIEQIKSYRFLNAVDVILVIPIDPLLGDFVHNPWFDDYDHLLRMQSKNTDKRYNALNNIGKPIYCLGGTNKIYSNIEKFPNLINLCESIPNFLEPEWNHPEVYFARNSVWYPLNPDITKETMDRIIQDCDAWGNLFRSEYFTVNHAVNHGNWLPNETGYEKIVEMVKEKLNLP